MTEQSAERRQHNLLLIIFSLALLLLPCRPAFAADMVRIAYVSPSISQSLPWIARERVSSASMIWPPRYS